MDLAPGDLLYLPRGTLHSVDSATESLHLALGFTPLTMHEALVAAVDHLADLDLPMRTTMGGRIAFQQRGGQIGPINAAINDAATRLLNAVKTPGFVASALERRASRVVGTFEAPPLRALAAPPTLESVVKHTATGFCHLTATPEHIDFSYPGGHLHIHRGAQDALLYMVNTPRFTVGHIPGVGDEVRLSLATSLMEINFLTEA